MDKNEIFIKELYEQNKVLFNDHFEKANSINNYSIISNAPIKTVKL